MEIGGNIVPPKKDGGAIFRPRRRLLVFWEAAKAPGKTGRRRSLQLFDDGYVPKQFFIVEGISPAAFTVAISDAAKTRTLDGKELD